jgi:hypothetical protein
MQHTLYPSAKTVQRSKPHYKLGAPEKAVVSARMITPLEHLRAAPLHVQLLGLVESRTHHAIMFACRIITRHQKGEPPSSEASTCGSDHLTIAYQSLPSECVKLGIDPRTLASKWADETATWEAGVWAPYITAEIDVEREDVGSEDAEVELSVDGREEGAEPDQKAGQQIVKILFASRYLLAKRDESSKPDPRVVQHPDHVVHDYETILQKLIPVMESDSVPRL